MKIAIGADHRGASSARLLADRLRSQGHEVEILGGASGEIADYPDPAWAVGRAVATGQAERGVLIDGTGIGVSIAANKVRGVRAALVHDELTAEISRTHNDANVLCVSADLLGQRLIEKIVDVWIATPFQGGRHERRLRKLAAIENGTDPSCVQ
jgi:ribose 5-phosphate isomerase B